MTREDLHNALTSVLGADVKASLDAARIRAPRQLEMAALKAFREDWNETDPALEVIRTGLRMLEHPGWFVFEEDQEVDA